MSSVTALAVDLGSSSGRVIAGTLMGGRIEEVEINRFAHEATLVDGYLCWDLDAIIAAVLAGLREATQRFPEAISVSVDTWGVDWVPLDERGQRVTPGRGYRDHRTDRTVDQFRAALPDDRAWELTGIAPATINSANQLFAYLAEEPEAAARTRQILFLPDYFSYLLSGVPGWSPSHASTSGLCAPGSTAWAEEAFTALGIPRSWVGELTPEHCIVGPCTRPGLEQLTVVRAGAHDTACAVHALHRDEAAETYFLSCGSWSVLGVLRDDPLMSEAARTLGLTNEARADHGVRPLFNITGLWILQECQRDWEAAGQPSDIVGLIEAAREADSLGLLIDPDESHYAKPFDMVARVTADLHAKGAPAELTQGQVVRTILESFAARYARGVADLAQLTGSPATQLNLVGGGSKNTLLCDLTATAIGVPVVAGPSEASTLGSLLAQFEVMGHLDPADRNDLIATTASTRRHEP